MGLLVGSSLFYWPQYSIYRRGFQGSGMRMVVMIEQRKTGLRKIVFASG